LSPQALSISVLPRDAMPSYYMLSSCVRLSARPSVRLSHAGIVSKRINVESHISLQRHTIA